MKMDKAELDECFREYKRTGDVALRNKIAEQYLYIAEILAKKFVGRGVEYDDLYQVACLSLIRGIERFDPDMGMQFTTFITPTMTGEIKNYFRDKSRAVKLPRKLAKTHADVRRAQEEITAETGKTPTPKEIADRLGISEEDVISAMEVGGVVSLDSMANAEEEDRSLYDVIPSDENPFESLEEQDALSSVMADFTESERELIRLRFGNGLSQMATAEKLHVSQMFVSRMERKLLKRMRERLSAEA